MCLCDRKDLVPVIIHRIWPLFWRGAIGGMELALIWIPRLDLGPGEQAEGGVSTLRIPRAGCMQCTAFPHLARAYRCALSPNLCFLGPGEIQRRLGQAKRKTWGSACPRSSPAPVTPTLLCAFLPMALPLLPPALLIWWLARPPAGNKREASCSLSSPHSRPVTRSPGFRLVLFRALRLPAVSGAPRLPRGSPAPADAPTQAWSCRPPALPSAPVGPDSTAPPAPLFPQAGTCAL